MLAVLLIFRNRLVVDQSLHVVGTSPEMHLRHSLSWLLFLRVTAASHKCCFWFGVHLLFDLIFCSSMLIGVSKSQTTGHQTFLDEIGLPNVILWRVKFPNPCWSQIFYSRAQWRVSKRKIVPVSEVRSNLQEQRSDREAISCHEFESYFRNA